MIYIYREKPSDSARVLAEKLGRRLRTNFRRVRPNDKIVCWGEHLEPVPTNVGVLNNAPIKSKYQDAVTLREKGVATIEVSRTRPPVVPQVTPIDPALDAFTKARDLAEEFVNLERFPGRSTPFFRGVQELEAALYLLRDVIGRPAPVGQAVPQVEWLGRMNSHVAGNDLLNPPATPDYFVKKEHIVEEFRVHSFAGKSIRAGKKIKIEGQTNHEWVRSLPAGWRISYDGVSVKQGMRDLAHSAVAALGLTFGAVDIGKKADGSLIVLEVNRAPGLDGGTIEVYSRAISEWATT
jgi:hypothetical protein